MIGFADFCVFSLMARMIRSRWMFGNTTAPFRGPHRATDNSNLVAILCFQYTRRGLQLPCLQQFAHQWDGKRWKDCTR